jgi:GT2 family glycosyltransferase
MADLSVIIVTWNSESEIENCIKSVIENSKDFSEPETELIVIDNNSTDQTKDKLNSIGFNNLQLHKNDANLGFTKAVNQGIKLSKGRNILLLNPDTVLKQNVLKKLSGFLDANEEYSACAPLMLNEDGSVQISIRNFPAYWSMYCEFTLLAYIFPKTKLFGKWKMKYFDYTKDADINQPMAAALMIKKSVLENIGIMDERFEMFFNDVDLCKRIIDTGSKIRFLKEAEVIHKKGASIYRDRTKMIRVWNKDCIKYFKKHNKNILLLTWLIISLKISEIIRILYIKLFK